MSYKDYGRISLCATLLLGMVITSPGCEQKGPAERAGESFDKGVQNAKDAINPPGPSEKAGRAIDKVIIKP